MIAATSLLTVKTKIIALAATSALLAVVDSQLPTSSIEDYSVKGILGVAVIVLYRLLLKSQADTTALRDKHEARLVGVIEANTRSNEKVCEMTAESSNYFKTVTRTIVDDRLHPKADQHPPIP